MKQVAASGDAQRFLTQAMRWKKNECLIWPYATAKNGGAAVITVRHPTKGWRGGAKTTVGKLICESAHGHAPSKTHVAARTCRSPACVAPAHFEWREFVAVIHSAEADAKSYRKKYPDRVRGVVIKRDYKDQARYNRVPVIHFAHGLSECSVDPEWDGPSWAECNP